MLKNYFKVAWRNMIRHANYTAINILGLTIGISSCLIIFLVTSFELGFDRFHPDKDRIYRVVSTFRIEGKEYPSGAIPSPTPMAIRTELTGVQAVAGFHNFYARVTVPIGGNLSHKFDKPKRGEEVSDVIIAEPQYFDIFKYDWLIGDPETSLKEPYKVVLSEDQAHKYFGSGPLEAMIGREVIYDDSLRVVLSGIVKDWNKRTDFAFKDFISYSTVKNSFLKEDINPEQWGVFNASSQAFVKLEKGTRPEQIEAQMPAFVKKHITLEGNAQLNISLQPLSDIHFNAVYTDLYSRKAHLPALYGLMGIGLFILIIAAINFINLSTAQSIQRAKEIGIRKVLGSSRSSLVFQFLAETFLLTCFAVIVSLGVIWPVLSFFGQIVPDGIGSVFFSPMTLLFLLLIVLVTTLLAGFYPARVLSYTSPAHILKGETSQKGVQRSYLRMTLIVFQFTVSLILIIGTLVVSNQIHFMLNKDLGFSKDAIINIETNGTGSGDKRKLLANRIRQESSVEMVSINMGTPANKDHSGTIIKLRDGGLNEVKAQFEMGDENYIPLFQLRILAGRNLLHSDTIKEFVINETCARDLGFKTPDQAIGKFVQVGIDDKTGPIVGVVADFHSLSLHESIQPVFITSSKDENWSTSVDVKLRTQGKEISHFQNSISAIRKIWEDLYPDKVFNYTFFDESIAKFYQKEQQTARIVNVAMVIAVLISCMGLFGMSTFVARQRAKEIGIRKTLGASVSNIIVMLSKDFIVLVGIAILISSPIAWYFSNNWLQSFAYRDPISWGIFAFAGITAILITLAATSFQAIKAATINPVKALRTD